MPSAKKKIGVRYCGGCNPTYERVEMIERVESQMKDQLLFLRHDQDVEGLVLINGCLRACASENLNLLELPNFSVAGEGDFRSLINWLIGLHKI